MSRGYTAEDRAAIARGEFYTDAELRAKPWLARNQARYATTPPGQPADPNNRPMTAARRAELDAMVPVCFYCGEPGDTRSALGDDGYHPECAEAWNLERSTR